MASISVTGIGSGVDINQLVTDLVSAERKPFDDLYNAQEAELLAEKTAWASFDAQVVKFETALKALNESTDFDVLTGTSGDTSLYTITPSSTAAPSSYNIKVSSLATAHKVVTGDLGSTTSTINTGTLGITVGSSSFSVTITSSNYTVAGIRDAINNATGNTLVDATTISDTSGTKLVLSSKQTGQANGVVVNVTSDGDGNDTDNAGLSQLKTSKASVASTIGSTNTESGAANSGSLSTLASGELTLGGIDVGASAAADDTLSSTDNAGSAIAIAAAINAKSFTTGVSATTSQTTFIFDVAGSLSSAVDLAAGELKINGTNVDVGNIAASGTAAATASAFITAINAVTSVTGITASGTTSVVTLTASDARNIQFQAAVTTNSASYLTSLGVADSTNKVARGSVTLVSSGNITVGGTAPTDADFSAGTTSQSSSTSVLATAADAKLEIDGLTVSSSNNSVTNISGVTINLLKADDTKTTTAFVSSDTTTLIGKIDTLVTEYNALFTLSEQLDFYDAENDGETNGALIGDPTLGTFMSQIKDKLIGAVTSPGGTFDTLAEIGVTIDEKGFLQKDTTMLNSAFSNNLSDVEKLFSSTNGVGNVLVNLLDDYTKTNGIFDEVVSRINKEIAEVDGKQAELNDDMTKRSAYLLSKLITMDSIVASLNATSDFLTEQLKSLPGVVKKD